MLQQITFVQTVQLAEWSQMIIKVSDSFEFTLYREKIIHYIENIKGDFEISKITETYDDGQINEIKYDEPMFVASDRSGTRTLTIYITATVNYDVIKRNIEMKKMCAVKYQLRISFARVQDLETGHFFRDEFILPGYNSLKFTYYVKKMNDSTENNIVVHIKNPYDVEIQGIKGDFIVAFDSTNSFDLLLLFSFYAEENEPQSNKLCEPAPVPAVDESRPESVIPSKFSYATNLLHKIGSNSRFADVSFIASDKTKIPSHRNFLVEFSDSFAKIFDETSVIPVQINVEDFDAGTVQSALNYLYDKSDAFIGKEMEVFKFAVKFGIQHLIDACVSFFEDSVDSTNVCEFIQIAYSHNFEHLKHKCLRILVEKKEEMELTKIAKLPQNILVDVYFFKL